MTDSSEPQHVSQCECHSLSVNAANAVIQRQESVQQPRGLNPNQKLHPEIATVIPPSQ